MNKIQSIVLDKLIAHPDNPNRMSKANFAKLVRNIERTGRYEPLVVRPHPQKTDSFEIINGHHRCKALRKLGYKTADAIIWNVDDEQAEILLATLNRLAGSDVLEKKLALLKKLSEKKSFADLAKLLPQTTKQIERLTNLKLPSAPIKTDTKSFAEPMVFFLTETQQQIIQQALSLAQQHVSEKTNATKKAAALTKIAQSFLNCLGECQFKLGIFNDGQKKPFEQKTTCGD